MRREEEFSPLKNSNEAKSENPNTCRKDITALHTKWLLNAGANFVENSTRFVSINFLISL